MIPQQDTDRFGDELGFYDAMSAGGPMGATGLAEATSCNARLTQEWLDQQASAYVRIASRAADRCIPIA